MKLTDDEMEIINKAEELTKFQVDVTNETHYLNDEEAMLLIRFLVEIIEEERKENQNVKL